MLVRLSIRDVVLIDRLDLALDGGLCVLTGETGAGKSILLDALGLALGNRAEQRLVRAGAEQAQVTAAFDVAEGHPALALLGEPGIALEDGQLILRRVLGADGRSRAFVNDQPVSIGFLRELGDSLVEIQGQFEDRGLLDPARHRGLLDAYGGLAGEAGRLAALWRAWAEARDELERARQSLDAAQAEESFLRHAVGELDAFDPQPGEEAALAEQRQLLMHREKLAEAVGSALSALSGGSRGGAESALALAQRELERVAQQAGERLDAALKALERAAAETEEAVGQLSSLAADLDPEPGRLQRIEERWFALKDLARKHRVEAAALPALRAELRARLAGIEDGAAGLEARERRVAAARAAYLAAAEALQRARAKAAARLDRAVNAELAPLKLERARFRTLVERAEEAAWGPQGIERVGFEVRTNPGVPPGPLSKIASGGELARFLLAIKVVLAQVNPLQTLVFDEVDSAVGGATAHAVGERLERLAADRQVLVVTHSPQVAARATHHWRVLKEAARSTGGPASATRAEALDAAARREEIARMLSGAEITDEARAAAERLMGAA